MIKKVTESISKHKESLYLLLVVFLISDAIYEFNSEEKLPFTNFAIILLLLPASLKKYIPEEKFKSVTRTTDILAIVFIAIALYFAFIA